MTKLDTPTIVRTNPERASQISHDQWERMNDSDNRPLVGPATIVGVLVLGAVLAMTILAATLGAIR